MDHLTSKRIDGLFESHQVATFLSQSVDYIINTLPHTPQTVGLLDSTVLTLSLSQSI